MESVCIGKECGIEELVFLTIQHANLSMTDAGHQNKMQEQGSDFQNILQTTYPRSLEIFTPKENIKGAEFGPAEFGPV